MSLKFYGIQDNDKINCFLNSLLHIRKNEYLAKVQYCFKKVYY